MYKQRHQPPNKKSSATANYAHIRYIATRPRVMKNEDMNHGLFGKLEVGDTKHFEDWKDISKLVYQNSKDGKIMYRSIISFSEETAKELLLSDQRNWERYIEKHIGTLAEQNKIKRENFSYVCAVHNEKSHPHVHIAFWDNSDKIRSAFTSPKIPNEIRKQLIKDTFKEKILALSQEKDVASKSMRSITGEMVDDFEKEFKKMKSKEYQKVKSYYAEEENELGYQFHFTDKLINAVADKVFRIKKMLPDHGRISYQLLEPEVKVEVDNLVKYILGNHKELQHLVDEYVNSKMKLATMYGGTDDYLKSKRKVYEKEAEKIIANRVLGMIRTLNAKDYDEIKLSKDISKREFLVTQMLYSAMDMLHSNTQKMNNTFDDFVNGSKELSKEAKKELYLKYQDKGYEH